MRLKPFLLAVLLMLSLSASAAYASLITISSVIFTGNALDPTVTIQGAAFGTAPTATAIATLGYTGLDYGTLLHITDTTSPLFDAGYDDPSNGYHDTIGLIDLSYTNTTISYQLGNVYTTYPEKFNAGDNFTVHIGNAAYTGIVVYGQIAQTPEPSSALLLITGVVGLLTVVRSKAFAK